MDQRLFVPDGPAVTPVERSARAAESRRMQGALALEFPRSATPVAEAVEFIDAAEALSAGWLDARPRGGRAALTRFVVDCEADR